jgi:hypothetical protein
MAMYPFAANKPRPDVRPFIFLPLYVNPAPESVSDARLEFSAVW